MGTSMAITDTVRPTVYLESDLHQALRLKSARSRRNMSDIVNEALRQALRGDQEVQEDLAAVSVPCIERAVSYEDFLARLKADGTL